MKQGQTFHPITCDCDFCKSGDTRFPIPCQATFKEHCQYPKCDCDRPAKAIPEEIMDVLDGPEQECYPMCQKGMTKDTCPYNPILGCDCGANPPNNPDNIIDPPLTREELEDARDYARRVNTELRTYDAHKSPEQNRLLEQLKEVEAKLNEGYVGGMTEYWNRRRSHLLKELQEVQMRDWNI